MEILLLIYTVLSYLLVTAGLLILWRLRTVRLDLEPAEENWQVPPLPSGTLVLFLLALLVSPLTLALVVVFKLLPPILRSKKRLPRLPNFDAPPARVESQRGR